MTKAEQTFSKYARWVQWVSTKYEGKDIEFKNNLATAAIMGNKKLSKSEKYKKLKDSGLLKERQQNF
jgi:hypothetical protein